jgi:hypothetical protein
VPTDATTVFSPVTYTGTGAAQSPTTNFPVDLMFNLDRPFNNNNFALDRLTNEWYYTNVTNQNSNALVSSTEVAWDSNTAFKLGSNAKFNSNTITYIAEAFQRAAGFADVVCYTGTGVARTVTHNLTVVPEMMIVWRRDTGSFQLTYHSALGNAQSVALYSNSAASAATWWNSTTPTSSVFSVSNQTQVNGSGATFVAWLFATCPGVSKVGSYTGTGTLTTINCGFTGGARFVLIKRTDTTGDWFMWDTARGMVAGTDPYLLLNSSAAEVNTNSVYTATTGFQLLASPSADVNTSSGSYIFLAIA